MLATQTQDSFLNLIRLGVGHSVSFLPDTIDWLSIEDFANKHGLLAVMIDGIERLPERHRPPKDLLLEWIGNTLQSYEQRYALYEKAIGKLAGLYSKHGYKMMLLKGYACSLDWPKRKRPNLGPGLIWLR